MKEPAPHNAYHRAAVSAAVQSVGYAVLCGLELTATQQRRKGVTNDTFCPWKQWVKEQCEFSYETACRYIRLAGGVTKGAKAKLVLLLASAPSELTDAQRKDLLKRVAGVTDGATLTELYQDYGIIRKPTGAAATGGYRPDEARVQAFLAEHHPTLAGTPYAALSPEVQAEFRAWLSRPETDQLQLALDEWTPILRHFDEKAPARTWMHLPHADLRRLHDALDAQVREMAKALADARA